jgi:hypothetical protein
MNVRRQVAQCENASLRADLEVVTPIELQLMSIFSLTTLRVLF